MATARATGMTAEAVRRGCAAIAASASRAEGPPHGLDRPGQPGSQRHQERPEQRHRHYARQQQRERQRELAGRALLAEGERDQGARAARRGQAEQDPDGVRPLAFGGGLAQRLGGRGPAAPARGDLPAQHGHQHADAGTR